ncbi:MAG TPA: nicotinate-nucleotide adenylyltransferase [Thermoanaerobaculia bacterium]|nr:nicotinate-nucleotide adenylyltransferase [Thermoanaerobaculia bacterium]
MKIAICGGTFDPFHRGHLDPVLAVRDELQWSTILYVPAWRQPFKSEQRLTSGHHRFAMAVLATESLEDIYVSPRELDRGAISYTVDTLEELRAEHPTATLDWVIGDDNLEQLMAWKNIDRIFELANFVVLARGFDPHPVPERFRHRVGRPEQRRRNGGIVFAANPAVPVSSTEIRRRIRAGEPVAELVAPRVWRYIQHNRLYQEALT